MSICARLLERKTFPPISDPPRPAMLMHEALPNAALIGAFTLRFHLNARRGRVMPRHVARTFATTLSRDIPLSSSLTASRFPPLRPDKEGDAGATRRASATRSHEPSRGIKRVLDSSLSRQTNGSHESAPKRAQLLPPPPLPPPRSPPPLAAHAPSSSSLFFSLSPSLRRLFSPRAFARSHERFVPTDVRSHT